MVLTKETKGTTLESAILGERGINPVTVGIVVACKDGVVIGADRKVTRYRGTRIKSLEDKIRKFTFKDNRNFLVCYSGAGDFAERAMEEIDPRNFDGDCSLYRDIIEGRISRLQSRHADRGVEYDAVLLFGTIDSNGKPTIGHITRSGVTELKNQGYFTTGIAAPYAELVLQDSYSKNLNVADARLIVGGLIERIGKVDNDVEGVDVFSILAEKAGKLEELDWAERHGIEYKPLTFNFKEKLKELKQEIDRWQSMLKGLEKPAKEKEGKSDALPE